MDGRGCCTWGMTSQLHQCPCAHMWAPHHTPSPMPGAGSVQHSHQRWLGSSSPSPPCPSEGLARGDAGSGPGAGDSDDSCETPEVRARPRGVRNVLYLPHEPDEDEEDEEDDGEDMEQEHEGKKVVVSTWATLPAPAPLSWVISTVLEPLAPSTRRRSPGADWQVPQHLRGVGARGTAGTAQLSWLAVPPGGCLQPLACTPLACSKEAVASPAWCPRPPVTGWHLGGPSSSLQCPELSPVPGCPPTQSPRLCPAGSKPYSTGLNAAVHCRLPPARTGPTWAEGMAGHGGSQVTFRILSPRCSSPAMGRSLGRRRPWCLAAGSSPPSACSAAARRSK